MNPMRCHTEAYLTALALIDVAFVLHGADRPALKTIANQWLISKRVATDLRPIPLI